jgi:aminoglycoside 3-N-acetyltransferase
MIKIQPSPPVSFTELFSHPEPLAIHGAFRSIRHLFETPHAFVEWVLRVRDGRQTLFPAFTGHPESYRDTDFDPSVLNCWTGVIPKAALEILGPAQRTLHPSHSWVGAGPGWRAESPEELEGSTPCGPQSPVQKVAHAGGRVLLLGIGLEALTLIHACEESAGVPYVLHPSSACVTVHPVGADPFTVNLRVHTWEFSRDYERLRPMLLSAGCLEESEWGTLVLAGSTFQTVEELLRVDPGAVLPLSG